MFFCPYKKHYGCCTYAHMLEIIAPLSGCTAVVFVLVRQQGATSHFLCHHVRPTAAVRTLTLRGGCFCCSRWVHGWCGIPNLDVLLPPAVMCRNSFCRICLLWPPEAQSEYSKLQKFLDTIGWIISICKILLLHQVYSKTFMANKPQTIQIHLMYRFQ